MEIKVATLAAAGAGSLIGLSITRPSSFTEVIISVTCGAACAYYAGPELAKFAPISYEFAVFLAGAFGMAAIRILNSVFVRVNKDPMAAMDTLITKFLPFTAKKA